MQQSRYDRIYSKTHLFGGNAGNGKGMADHQLPGQVTGFTIYFTDKLKSFIEQPALIPFY